MIPALQRSLPSTIAALALTAFLPGIVVAQSPSARVEIRVGAVLASNRGTEFDHRLASMRRQFDNLFSYTSYRLVKEQSKQVSWGSHTTFSVPNGPYVLVIPREYRNNRVLMKVVIIDNSRPIVDTLLSLHDRGTFLVGGPRQGDGVLILSIAATPVVDALPVQ